MSIVDTATLTRLNDTVRTDVDTQQTFRDSIIPQLHMCNNAASNAESTSTQDWEYLMGDIMPRVLLPMCEQYCFLNSIPFDKISNPSRWFSRKYASSLIISETGMSFSRPPRTSKLDWANTIAAVIIAPHDYAPHQNYMIVRSHPGRTDIIDIGLYVHHGSQHVTKSDHVILPDTEIEGEYCTVVDTFSRDVSFTIGMVHFLEQMTGSVDMDKPN